MNKGVGAGIAWIMLLFVLASGARAQESITIELDYQSGTQWDVDDDGVETAEGVIDFTVAETVFSASINYSSLATKWEIYSLDNQTVTAICYGSSEACGYIGLVPLRDTWNDSFDLYYGYYGTGSNNMVGARVFGLGKEEGNLIAQAYYSEWANLSATFTVEDESESQSTEEIVVHSPNNASSLASGEDVLLNYSLSQLGSTEYALDGNVPVELGEGRIFSDVLQGLLSFNVMQNGLHLVEITALVDNASSVLRHSFVVQDENGPDITVNVSDGVTIYDDSNQHAFEIHSDEHAAVSYSFNGGSSTDVGLGEDNTVVITLELQEGENTLVLNATDVHGNSRLHETTFMYSLTGSCSDGRQNGDETGIDCGGRCAACVAFSVSTSQLVYAYSDLKLITVVARSDSEVDVVISRNGETAYSHTFVPPGPSSTISETRFIDGLDEAGIYTVTGTLHYLNHTELIAFDIEVLPPITNSLSVSISTNGSTVDEGSTVVFSASVGGQTGSVTYAWDFGNDGSIESNDAGVTRGFANNGTYTVNLTVRDSQWNQSDVETITVRKLYNITVKVVDNVTGSAVQDAEISIQDFEKNSSSDGVAAFTVRKGTHRLKVTKDGYDSFANDTIVERSREYSVRLVAIDTAAPSITLVSPDANFVSDGTNLTITYRAEDSSRLTCRLYMNWDESGWILQETQSGIDKGTDVFFHLHNLRSGVHQWRIDCVDAEGNTQTSEERSITVDATAVELVNVSEEDSDIQLILGDSDAAISSIKDLQGVEKEAAEAMQVLTQLEKSKIQIERASRDLHNLKWRRLNETGEKELKDQILSAIEQVRRTAPRNIRVLEETEFVKYPSRSDVENATARYLEYMNLKLSRRQEERLTEDNVALQSHADVRTKAMIVEVESIAGTTETVTVISKFITFDETDGFIFFEVIPKELARSVNETELLFDYNVIEEDPIIEIAADDARQFSYYFRKRVNIDLAENTRSILLQTEIDEARKIGITGLATLNDMGSRLLHSSHKRLIIEIIIIIILAAIYLMYTFGDPQHMLEVITKRTNKQAKLIEEKVRGAEACLAEGLYTKSKAQYREIDQLFKQVPKELRADIYPKVIALGHKLDVFFINILLDESFAALQHGNKDEAHEKYTAVTRIYSRIAPDFKAAVLQRCMELNKKLKGG